jgi:ABC-type spermidine/putrescine transport system permease subunit II
MAVEVSMSLKWYQDDSGDTSMLRIGAMIGVCVGALAVLIGVILAVVEVAMEAHVQAGATVAGIGSGLIGTVLGMKALQRMAEAKIP